jgi:hypothetical protein
VRGILTSRSTHRRTQPAWNTLYNNFQQLSFLNTSATYNHVPIQQAMHGLGEMYAYSWFDERTLSTMGRPAQHKSTTRHSPFQ